MATLNIGSVADDWRAKRLSNFSDDPFELDGRRFASVEGFIQGIKFPDGDPRRSLAFVSVGAQAKRIGHDAFDPKSAVWGRRVVWWGREQIPFGSFMHQRLIERAIRAKFEQNERARRALLATAGTKLTHDMGHPESRYTSLPARVFCDILTRIRTELLAKEG